MATLSERLDTIATLRKDRLALQKTIDKMKAEEDGLATALASELREANIEELRGEVGKIKLKTTESADVVDYPAFYQYIKEHDAFDLLQRRVSLAGVRERWQEGNEIPGVARVLEESFTLGTI